MFGLRFRITVTHTKKFLETKMNTPKLTQKQRAKHMVLSGSIIERNRIDINMDSSFNRNKIRSKKRSQKPTVISERLTGGRAKLK